MDTSLLQPERGSTRSSLLRRIKDLSDVPGWSRFYDTYAPLVERFALKAGLTKLESQEVVQNTMIQVAQKIDGFEYDRSKGSFKSWMFACAKWRILDARRQRKKGPLELNEDDESAEAGESGFEAIWDAEWQGHLWREALEATKRKVSGAHFQIFCLYVIEGLPPEKVSKMLGVTVAHVYLIKCRVSRLIKKELVTLRKE
jgi:RNA polymerase sigma factor (sigma-70 family)